MIKNTFLEISENFRILSENNVNDIEVAAKTIINSINKRGKILFCGNGGSASDAQHLAAELVVKYKKIRAAIPAIALTTDTSIITACANDFDFKYIFSRQIEALGNKNDILFAITTSGKSLNIVEAVKAAKKKKLKVILLKGKNTKSIDKECELVIKVPSNKPDRIQEMHIAIGQILCEIIEQNYIDGR